MYSKRYVFDALYGPVWFPDYVWEVVFSPELQRLREVRLCNINSLSLTGGANTNRYEHALGTAYLALIWLQSQQRNISTADSRALVIAALLHDIGSAAFGHSTQYVLGPKYRHESIYDMLTGDSQTAQPAYRYQRFLLQHVYFGMPRRLPHLIEPKLLRYISDIIEGRGTYGPLINGSMDLDNMDNVYRLAYHMGFVRSAQGMLDLLPYLLLRKGKLVIDKRGVPLVEEWYRLRTVLYRFLLLNPDEFAAKCMLQEALELAQDESSVSFAWQDVDFQLVEKLFRCSAKCASITARLMLGDLYGCAGIFSVDAPDLDGYFLEQKRREMEECLQKELRGLADAKLKPAKEKKAGLTRVRKPPKNLLVAIHAIKDVNKTQRALTFNLVDGGTMTIGTASRRFLVGVFLKNADLSMQNIKPDNLRAWGFTALIRNFLQRTFPGKTIKDLTPYEEVSEV
ncbi:MAG: HD domain-containing protein [Candidatus Hydrogenedentes bacterium]|nr:HD domain-containing protein [Candidatus Hydrogenedentota bacterium]